MDQETRDALDRDTEVKRMSCEKCDSSLFAIFYDPVAQGFWTECATCGAVILDV